MVLHPEIEAVTGRIVKRSAARRQAYLDLIRRQRDEGVQRKRLSCGNFAHGFAASGEDKATIRGGRAQNIGIVTAYNDMLSAHQPYGPYPAQLKIFAREMGATAQVAGGVPAMCDGVTQGMPGMELSPVQQGHDCAFHGGGAQPRHVRVCRLAGDLRQDRAGAADRCIAVRAFADVADPVWADAERFAEQGEGAGAPAACGG